ncbi:MAG: methylated-DNA--[protein]-cysteine S-methyltransferase [Acidimicrobiales bacterium]
MAGLASRSEGSPSTRRSGVALFDTAIGRCGIAWRDDSVVGVQIPESSDEETLRRLRAKRADASGGPDDATTGSPPPAIVSAIEGMRALLDGEQIDLNFVDVDFGQAPSFEAEVWEATRAIQPGASLTYGEIAMRIGRPGGAQAVGKALGANPCPIVVPCHRVIGADGQLVGFSANGGTETKRRMLLIERCPAVPPNLFDAAGFDRQEG